MMLSSCKYKQYIQSKFQEVRRIEKIEMAPYKLDTGMPHSFNAVIILAMGYKRPTDVPFGIYFFTYSFLNKSFHAQTQASGMGRALLWRNRNFNQFEAMLRIIPFSQ